MTELVARVGADGGIRHVRDADYFAWRFGNLLSFGGYDLRQGWRQRY